MVQESKTKERLETEILTESVTELVKREKKKEEHRVTKQQTVEEKKEVIESVSEKTEEKKGLFTKIKETFTTRTISAEKFDDLFWPLEVLLLEHNVAVDVMERIKNDLKGELVDKPLPLNVGKKVEETLRRTLIEVLRVEPFSMAKKIQEKKKTSSDPYVIAFLASTVPERLLPLPKSLIFCSSKK